jgi:hypothetical protein
MTSGAKSQELIQKLLTAEEKAEKIVSAARENRARKLRDVRAAAEEELEPFRLKVGGSNNWISGCCGGRKELEPFRLKVRWNQIRRTVEIVSIMGIVTLDRIEYESRGIDYDERTIEIKYDLYSL